ncbi:hypothetical protein [Rhizobium ruizarguesonis]|nr:hypothetical protein [Rhizobium ruizarguesonis]
MTKHQIFLIRVILGRASKYENGHDPEDDNDTVRAIPNRGNVSPLLW